MVERGSAGFDAFEKMKRIFSIAPVESLRLLRECFTQRNTHRTLCVEPPDAGLNVRCTVGV